LKILEKIIIKKWRIKSWLILLLEVFINRKKVYQKEESNQLSTFWYEKKLTTNY